VRGRSSSIATQGVREATSDRCGVASNSLFWNILPVTSYSTIFCEQSAVYASAKHREISILPRVQKKMMGRGHPRSAPAGTWDGCPSSKELTSLLGQPSLEVVLLQGHPTSGGVTASTEMLAAKRHAGVHTPVIVGKMIIANQQMAYAA
jgi:hypothetical protein